MMLKSKERPKAAQAMPRVLVRVERRMECGCPSVSVMVIVSLSPSVSMIATVILEHRARSVILLVISTSSGLAIWPPRLRGNTAD